MGFNFLLALISLYGFLYGDQDEDDDGDNRNHDGDDDDFDDVCVY